jgi:hypothetical protein
MALTSIQDKIHLYISSEPEDILISHELIAWFDHTEYDCVRLNYTKYQKQEVLAAINSWLIEDNETGIIQEPLVDFPFVVYTEVHADNPDYTPKKYIFGKDNIISQIPALYALGK